MRCAEGDPAALRNRGARQALSGLVPGFAVVAAAGSAHSESVRPPPLTAFAVASLTDPHSGHTPGVQLMCTDCHAPHATGTPRLGARWDQKTTGAPDPGVEKAGEDLCCTCHTGAANSSGGPGVDKPPADPSAAFTSGTNDYVTTDGDPVAIFHHPIAPGDQAFGARVVECSSCHNSHIVDSTDSATTSKIVNPGDVSQKWYVRRLVGSKDWGMNRTSPWTDMVSFCESCHNKGECCFECHHHSGGELQPRPLDPGDGQPRPSGPRSPCRPTAGDRAPTQRRGRRPRGWLPPPGAPTHRRSPRTAR